MTLQYLVEIVKEMNKESLEKTGVGLESIECASENSNAYRVDYRKPFIPYNQELNMQAIHAGAA